LDNAQMVESLQKSTNELRAAYEATLEGWARALELRDKETEGHAQRVTSLTLALARRLGVPEERLPHIRRGALLHDIGKIGVPDHILKKPGPLDEEEWEIMRQHPLWAYEMLKDIPYLQPALAIPLFHHERWDGSGYPSGLVGTAIPLAARIFAVVDVYDALTSDRPYRSAWSREKALAYLKEQRGKLFDPRVVDAFLETMQSEGPPADAKEPPPSP
jgi:putative nucleotidyltransferase with HDIG domain